MLRDVNTFTHRNTQVNVTTIEMRERERERVRKRGREEEKSHYSSYNDRSGKKLIFEYETKQK